MPEPRNAHPAGPDLSLLLKEALQAHQQGDFARAQTLYEGVRSMEARHFDATHLLGVLMLQQGEPETAVRLLCDALRISPDASVAHLNLGFALLVLNRSQEALFHFQGSLLSHPHDRDALLGQALALRGLRRYEEALASVTKLLAEHGVVCDALQAHGAILVDLQRPSEALASLDRALALSPPSVEIHETRGNALLALQRFEEALESYDRALAIDPNRAISLRNRSIVLLNLGRHQEALESDDRAIAVGPKDPIATSNRIFLLDFVPDLGFIEHQMARRQFFKDHASDLPAPAAFPNLKDPNRRLTLGYVSADFRHHSAAACFGPIVRNHDKSKFKVICYSGVVVEDDWTQEFRKISDEWRSTALLSDEELAEQVRQDTVDILIDLSGHTQGSRLMMFARKPAPVQVTAWGHGGGTGLPMMDYLFTDSVYTPSEFRPLFAEASFDLPCCLTFEAPAFTPPVTALPARSAGFVTFGGLNRTTKTTPAILALWAQLLDRIPNSHLLMKDGALDQANTRQVVLGAFTDRGISPNRIQLLGRTDHAGHLATYGQVDIALDTHPQNGGANTWEALWMGVPVITMLGSTPPSRISGAILHALGLDDWISEYELGYLERVTQKASDLDALADFRRGIRDRITASSAGNPNYYTRAVEDAYRVMWMRWISS